MILLQDLSQMLVGQVSDPEEDFSERELKGAGGSLARERRCGSPATPRRKELSAVRVDPARPENGRHQSPLSGST
jgi:hypothetical protein